MSRKTTINTIMGVIAVLLIVIMIAPSVVAQIEGWTNFSGLNVQATSFATGTPMVLIENDGASVGFEVRNSSGTPVYQINADGSRTEGGAVTAGGALDMNGNIITNIGDSGTDFDANGGLTLADGLTGQHWVNVSSTAVATGTAVAVINNTGTLPTAIFDVQDSGTSQLKVLDDGGVQVAAPTAVGTAVPALQVDSSGGLSNLLEVRDSATPVFQVHDGGNVTGLVLRYATAGTQIICGTETITDNTTASHGLTTPLYATCTLAQDPTGDAQSCSTDISGSTVTVKVWQSAATPAANTAGASTTWCVIGTP